LYCTPLHRSSWWEKQGFETTENLLLKHGAIIDVEVNQSRTPLQLALEHGRHDIVKCLSEHGGRWRNATSTLTLMKVCKQPRQRTM
jgi:ankyrin repeat protein